MRPRRCGAASDGWMLYVRVHPLIGCCKLCFKCGCSCVDHPGWGRVDESTCVRGNYTALNTHMSDYAVQLAHESQANLNQLGCEVCRTGGGIFQRHALLQPLTRSRVCVCGARSCTPACGRAWWNRRFASLWTGSRTPLSSLSVVPCH